MMHFYLRLPASNTILPTIPAKYRCSLTGKIFFEPAFTSDGMTYEKESIENWFIDNATSPTTGVLLPNKNLIPNIDKKSDITEFLMENVVLIQSEELYLPESTKIEIFEEIRSNNIQNVERLLNNDGRLCYLIQSDFKEDSGISLFFMLVVNLQCKWSNIY